MATVRHQVSSVFWACISWAFALALGILSEATRDTDASVWLSYGVVIFILIPPFLWFLEYVFSALPVGEPDDAPYQPRPRHRPSLYRCMRCSDLVNILNLDGPSLTAGAFVCRRCAGEPVDSTRKAA